MQTGNEKYKINPDHYGYYDFLEQLRKSGITNMYGASPYLQEAFDELDRAQANLILATWMMNYDELLKLRKWKRDDL